jgi:hypothetical protein
MSLYEFNAGVIFYNVLSDTKPQPMSDKDFDEALNEIRSYNLPDVEV